MLALCGPWFHIAGMIPDPEIEWQVANSPVPYSVALHDMDVRAEAIRGGQSPERVWLLEHPPLYTAGTSAAVDELLAPGRFPVYAAGRGGRYTYHGPGQRVGYIQVDLNRRGRDVRSYVHGLENWVVAALADLGVAARTIPGRIGIWVGEDGSEAKIGAIGVRVRRWVTMHGFSINVSPDLSHFSGIVPCGLDQPVTSLAALGAPADLGRLDEALLANLEPFLTGLSIGLEDRPLCG